MNPVLIVLLSIFALIVFILVMPVHLVISVNNETLSIFLRVLFLKFFLYPQKEKKKKEKAKKTTKTKKEKKKGKAKKTDTPKMTVGEIIKYVTGLSKVLIEKSLKHLHIYLRKYDVEVGTDDAAKTAIVYGSINALSSNLLAILSAYGHLKIAKNSKGVYCNFVSEEIKTKICIDFMANVIKALAILLPTAIQYIKIKQELGEGDTQNGK